MNTNKNIIYDGKPGIYYEDYNKHIEKLDKLIEENKVNNIGLLGRFSSGKSSLIKTYKTMYSDKIIIRVSLGKFNVDMNKESNTNDSELELSIIEQLMLSKHRHKINGFKSKFIMSVRLVAIVSIILTLIYHLLSLSIIRLDNDIYIMLNNFSPFINILKRLKNFIILTAYISILYVVIKTIYLIYTGQFIKKITYKDAKIDFNTKDGESLVNKNMKVLINFFDNIKASIVVFEDLDRFKNMESILIKLKEINEIINSKRRIRIFFNKNNKKKFKIDNRLIFIYAISQETIKSPESRTKFFEGTIILNNVLTTKKLELEIEKLIKERTNTSGDINYKLISLINAHINDIRVFNSMRNDFNEIYSDPPQRV